MLMRALIAAAALASCAAHAHTVILYSRADAAHAAYVRALQELAGAEVVQDINLPPGALWRPAMLRLICTADTVVVLWSERAAQSPEVAAEWRIAAGCAPRVVPVMLDRTPLPAELGARQGIVAP